MARNTQHFAKGSGVYKCLICQHNTRDTGGDNTQARLCTFCWDLSGEENSVSDNGRFYESKANVKATADALEKRSGEGLVARHFPGVAALLKPTDKEHKVTITNTGTATCFEYGHNAQLYANDLLRNKIGFTYSYE